MSKEIVGEEPVVSSEGQESVGRGRAKTLRGRVFAGFLFFLLISPAVYGTITILFSTFVNRAFHHPKECTITAVVAQKSGSKSSSSSSTIYIQSPDCSDLEFQGDRWGLSDKEVVEQIREFKGQKVVVEVGVWQVPLSPTVIVGIEGLDLSK